MKKFHQNQFLIFLQEDQNKLITKEKEKIKKVEELEQKRLKVDVSIREDKPRKKLKGKLKKPGIEKRK
jgi:hypothetical protein